MAIYSMWRTDLTSFVKLKATLAKNFHIQPNEIDMMPYWEFELFIHYINETVKEENDAQKAEMDKYHMDEHMNNMNPNKMSRMMSKPPSMQMPKMNIPSININMPKF